MPSIHYDSLLYCVCIKIVVIIRGSIRSLSPSQCCISDSYLTTTTFTTDNETLHLSIKSAGGNTQHPYLTTSTDHSHKTVYLH